MNRPAALILIISTKCFGSRELLKSIFKRIYIPINLLETPNIQADNLEKLNKQVQFPEVLNLSPYMSGTGRNKHPVYHLYAVVVHLGMMNSAYSGHYVSYVKDFREDWFKIDDSRVSPVDLETVLSEKAYILFYARHSPRGPSFVENSSM